MASLHWRRRFSLALRDYQEECIRVCLEEYGRGVRRQAVSLPVGSGKTMIFSNLIQRLAPLGEDATKTLVLAHREELLGQAARMIERVSPGTRISIEQGASRADPDASDVVVASVPTLGRKDCRRLENYDPRMFKAVIIDEAHHAAATTYKRIFEHFGLLPDPSKEPPSSILLWGCSATFSRNDHLELGEVFEKVVYHVEMQRLIQEGWLCQPVAISVHTDIDLDRVQVSPTTGDFDADELSLAIDTPARNRLIVETWIQTAAVEHRRKSTIVFCLNIKHVESLSREFSAHGVSTAAVTGSTPDSVRQEILEQFSSGDIAVLLNCAVLTEGTDLPRTDCILLTRPTCNPNLYVQMVGRGLRRHPDKEHCLVLDVVDKLRSPKRTLSVFPSLFPSKASGAFDPDTEKEPSKRRMFDDSMIDKVRVTLRECNLSDSFFSLGAHRIAWVPVGSTRSIMLAADRDVQVILEIDAPGKGPMTCTLSAGPPKAVGEAKTWCPAGTLLHEALEIAVQRLKLDYPRSLHTLSRDAYWRRMPASRGQLDYIRRIGRVLSVPAAALYESVRWDMGRASDAIGKYNFMRGRDIGCVWQDIFSSDTDPSMVLVRAPRSRAMRTVAAT